MIVLAAGAGGVAALTTLSGCKGTKATAGASIGEPIPSDPVLKRPVVSARSAKPSVQALPTTLTPNPVAIGRTKWTRESAKRWLANPMGRVNRITIHHDGMPQAAPADWAGGAQRLDAIRRGHLRLGWADIGYHYAIDPGGRVWAARPLELQGAHVKDNNEQNIGIVMLGNYDNQHPTSAARQTLVSLVNAERLRFGVPLNRVFTHQELRATACPGRNLQAFMRQGRAPGGSIALAQVRA